MAARRNRAGSRRCLGDLPRAAMVPGGMEFKVHGAPCRAVSRHGILRRQGSGETAGRDEQTGAAEAALHAERWAQNRRDYALPVFPRHTLGKWIGSAV